MKPKKINSVLCKSEIKFTLHAVAKMTGKIIESNKLSNAKLKF